MPFTFKLVQVISETKHKTIISCCSRNEIFAKIMKNIPDFPCLELVDFLEELSRGNIDKFSKASYLFIVNKISYKLIVKRITRGPCTKGDLRSINNLKLNDTRTLKKFKCPNTVKDLIPCGTRRKSRK